MKKLLELFKREKKAKKGLMAIEWVVMGYLAITTLLMLFTYTKVHNPGEMLWGRVQIVIMTLALWAVYRMLPCRFTRLCRILAQMALLSWWYPDTYEFNRMFPNLDHIFAVWEQGLFGCQPALLFSQWCSWSVFSELMILGYWSYYPMIYQLVSYAHNACERPTAAFPSSHVGVSTILMLLIWTARNRRLLYWLLPFYVLLCLSTVYIYAHYAIDVLGGWVSAIVLFFGLKFYYDHFIRK